MKKGIHPDYKTVTYRCTTCGNTFEGGSILDEVVVDTCSNCHPFYTGKKKRGKAAGRVERFNQRYGRKSEDDDE